MEFIRTPLEGLYIIEVNKLTDNRGIFARTFCKKEFGQIGFDKEFVQFNHSENLYKGTIRGMHFQRQPYSEVKLIRCVKGRVYDVAVDLRKNSETYLKSFSVELNEQNLRSILIPEGFAHGYQALEDHSTLIYHHSEYYTPGADSGIRYNDPALGIEWPLEAVNISDKDKSYTDITNTFEAIQV